MVRTTDRAVGIGVQMELAVDDPGLTDDRAAMWMLVLMPLEPEPTRRTVEPDAGRPLVTAARKVDGEHAEGGGEDHGPTGSVSSSCSQRWPQARQATLTYGSGMTQPPSLTSHSPASTFSTVSGVGNPQRIRTPARSSQCGQTSLSGTAGGYPSSVTTSGVALAALATCRRLFQVRGPRRCLVRQEELWRGSSPERRSVVCPGWFQLLEGAGSRRFEAGSAQTRRRSRRRRNPHPSAQP